MNQNDFYKELMSKYAFDADKIKTAAIRKAKRPFVERLFVEHKAVTTCAAAAIMLTAGVYGFVGMGGAPSLDITEHDNVLSAAQRLEEAESNYASFALATDTESAPVEMYISFNEVISYSEALMTFSSVSDTGDVQPATVYFSDGTSIPRSEIPAFAAARNGEKIVTGMKITAPAAYYKNIQDLNIVYLAELASDKLNDSTFKPVGGAAEADATTTASAVASTTPEPSVTEPPVVIGGSSDAVEIRTDIVTTGTTPDVTEDTVFEEITSVPDIDEPDESESTSETLKPDTELIVTTEEGTAPENGEYTLDIENAYYVAEISDNDVIILCNEAAYVYRIDGVSPAEMIAEIELFNPRVEYASSLSDRIIISGASENAGGRNTLIDFSTVDYSYSTYNIDSIVSSGELGGIFCPADEDCIFVKSVAMDANNVYHIAKSGENVSATPIVTSIYPIVPLSYCDNVFTYALTETDKTVVYTLEKGETEAAAAAEYTADAVFSRSNFFDSYAVTDVVDGEEKTVVVGCRGASCTIPAGTRFVLGRCKDGKIAYLTNSGAYVVENGVTAEKTAEETADIFDNVKAVSSFDSIEADGSTVRFVKKN